MLPIKELRKKLRARRRELFKEVADIEDDLLWLETDVESEREERAQDENMLRLLACLDDRGKAEIEEIDQAFARIESGDYGRCEVCKKPIPLTRLKALPSASLCLPCARAREKTPT